MTKDLLEMLSSFVHNQNIGCAELTRPETVFFFKKKSQWFPASPAEEMPNIVPAQTGWEVVFRNGYPQKKSIHPGSLDSAPTLKRFKRARLKMISEGGKMVCRQNPLEIQK